MCSWGFVLSVSVCVATVTLGPGLSSILLIDGALLRTSLLCWEGLATRASNGSVSGWAQNPLRWVDTRSRPRCGKEGTAAPDLVAVGGGAKKGLTSDGGVYNVIT